MNITVLKRRGVEAPHGDKTWSLEVPTLPRVGDYLSHDKFQFSGTVKRVQWWWNEKGKLADIEVEI